MPQPANSRATESARMLLQYLASLPRRSTGRVISGQHIADYPAAAERNHKAFVAELERRTGRRVGLVGMGYSEGRPEEYRTLNQLLMRCWRRGSLVTLDAHPPNPWTGGSAWDLTSRNLVDLLTPGTRANKAWMAVLDRMAAGLQELRDADVVVLWRPFHEMNFLKCFWWDMGACMPDPEPWRMMWRHMFEYFVEKKSLHNLLWVYAAANYDHNPKMGCLAVYPGDEFVDIVGVDVYSDTCEIRGNAYGKLTALGKPFGITECGPTTMDGSFDASRVIHRIRDAYPQTSFFHFWHSWGRTALDAKKVALVDQQNASQLLDDPWVLTAEEIRWRSA